MTATLLAILIENGNLTWTTNLSEALPNMGNSMSAGHRNTTLAMLAAHRSGITGEINVKNRTLWTQLYDPQLQRVDGRQLVIQSVVVTPPDLSPNTTYSYSNTNYMILGHIIYQRGIVWEQLIHKKLWAPLGMTGCGFGTPPESSLTAIENPWPHYFLGSIPIPVTPDALSDNPPTLGPAGTVHCSMPSYSKFLALHLDGLKGKDTVVLKASSFETLHTPYPGQNYTSGGWATSSDDRFGGSFLWHTGSNTLNYALAVLAPSRDDAFAGLTNVGGLEADNGTSEAAIGFFDGSLDLSAGSQTKGTTAVTNAATSTSQNITTGAANSAITSSTTASAAITSTATSATTSTTSSVTKAGVTSIQAPQLVNAIVLGVVGVALLWV
jgi:D-alanyl-D-alanine carboxypeptidase